MWSHDCTGIRLMWSHDCTGIRLMWSQALFAVCCFDFVLTLLLQLRREGRIKDVGDVVKRGQRVKVKVLSVTGSNIRLSMKVTGHLC